MWKVTRSWEEKWESLKMNQSKMAEQELDDEDRQARFWRRRPDGFAVNEKEHRLSLMSGLASNPANREIASSSGASEHKDIFFSIFFQFFFSCIF